LGAGGIAIRSAASASVTQARTAPRDIMAAVLLDRACRPSSTAMAAGPCAWGFGRRHGGGSAQKSVRSSSTAGSGVPPPPGQPRHHHLRPPRQRNHTRRRDLRRLAPIARSRPGLGLRTIALTYAACTRNSMCYLGLCSLNPRADSSDELRPSDSAMSGTLPGADLAQDDANVRRVSRVILEIRDQVFSALFQGKEKSL